jgi:hypothetical protein
MKYGVKKIRQMLQYSISLQSTIVFCKIVNNDK